MNTKKILSLGAAIIIIVVLGSIIAGAMIQLIVLETERADAVAKKRIEMLRERCGVEYSFKEMRSSSNEIFMMHKGCADGR